MRQQLSRIIPKTLFVTLLLVAFFTLAISGCFRPPEDASLLPSDFAGDFFAAGDGIYALDLQRQQAARIVPPPGKELWQDILQDTYGMEWEKYSLAFYEQVAWSKTTGKVYAVCLWSRDGSNLEAAVLIECNSDGSALTVIADHLAFYPPDNSYFSLAPDGSHLAYYDENDTPQMLRLTDKTKVAKPHLLPHWSHDGSLAWTEGLYCYQTENYLPSGKEVARNLSALKAAWPPDSNEMIFYFADQRLWRSPLAANAINSTSSAVELSLCPVSTYQTAVAPTSRRLACADYSTVYYTGENGSGNWEKARVSADLVFLCGWADKDTLVCFTSVQHEKKTIESFILVDATTSEVTTTYPLPPLN